MIMLKPTSDGKGKRKFMLNGRKSKAIVTELVDNMPEHVATSTHFTPDPPRQTPSGLDAIYDVDEVRQSAVLARQPLITYHALSFGWG